MNSNTKREVKKTPPTTNDIYKNRVVIYDGVYNNGTHNRTRKIKMNKQQLELSKLQNGSISFVSSVRIVLWHG